MVKKLLVTPREFGKYISKKKRKTKGLAVISICSKKEDLLFTEEVKKQLDCDVLNLIFADLTATDYKIAPDLISKFPAFTKRKAQQTIKFLDNIKKKEIDLLLIHCDAGVSRSAAVGIFACRYLGMDENEFRKEHHSIGPNSLVYDLLQQESGMRDDYQKWWEEEVPPNSKLIFT
jgi:predicted protein tyrosine phosphatase